MCQSRILPYPFTWNAIVLSQLISITIKYFRFIELMNKTFNKLTWLLISYLKLKFKIANNNNWHKRKLKFIVTWLQVPCGRITVAECQRKPLIVSFDFFEINNETCIVSIHDGVGLVHQICSQALILSKSRKNNKHFKITAW